MKIIIEGPIGARTRINGREFDYFSGTGYLGLQNNPEVLAAAKAAIEQYGLFSPSSRGGYGEHPLYLALERQACLFFGVERVVYLPSGYMGIGAIAQAESGKFDHIFIDASAHFSLWDAANATNRPITPFHHLSEEALEDCLRRELGPGEKPLVLSDGVFPISGEIAPLPDYIELARRYNGLVFLDDAHSVGVLGANGRGTADYFGVQDEVCKTAATLAKALGGYGGILWGEKSWAERIERNAGSFVGASPPPLVVAAASAKALSIARTSPDLRDRLHENVRAARTGLRQLGWALADSPVPILCLEAHQEISLDRIQAGLHQNGIAVTLARGYSSAPPGGALRIAIMATHTRDQIDRLITEIGKLI